MQIFFISVLVQGQPLSLEAMRHFLIMAVNSVYLLNKIYKAFTQEILAYMLAKYHLKVGLFFYCLIIFFSLSEKLC